MSLAHLLLLLLASLLMGCPDRGGANTTADALDAAEEEWLDAKDDLAADRADARRDARRDASAPDAPMDAEDERLDAEEEAPDSTVATDGSVEAALDAARCDPDARVPCRCFHGVSGAHYCHRSGRMGACLCVRGEADGGVRPLPPRLVAPLSASRVTSQRPTLRWVPPSGVERSVVELCRDRACTRRLVQEEVRGNAWRPTSALTPGITFWRVRGLAADGGVAWSSATWSFSVKHRDAPTDTSTHPIRDFNGDGYDDVVVTTSGAVAPVLVYHGSTSGLRPEPAVSLRTPEFDSQRYGSSFGSDGTVGDFNGDGYADLAIGEPTYRPVAPSSDRDYGHVHMYWGGADGIRSTPTQRLAMPAEVLDRGNFQFGTAVGAVDFDGDGFDDLLALRQAASEEFPRAYLFLGRTSGVATAPSSVLHSEESINTENRARGIGDVDGDGYGDFAIGLPRARIGRNQSLVVVYGNPDGDLGRRVELHEADSRLRLYIFSYTVQGGDYNGDGLADIACGSWNVVQVAYGTPEGIEVDTPLQSPIWGSIADGFGQHLQIQGDLDGDGRTDLTSGGACEDPRFGSMSFPCWYGAVFLFRSSVAGVMSMWDRLFFSSYGANDGGFERSASPGDVNGDGIDDLLVGVPSAVPPDAGSFPDDVLRGAVHGYLGGPWDWTRPSFTVRSPQVGIQIGSRLF